MDTITSKFHDILSNTPVTDVQRNRVALDRTKRLGRCALCGGNSPRTSNRCSICTKLESKRLPAEPDDYFDIIEDYATDLGLSVVHDLEPSRATGWACWFASPLESRWFGFADDHEAQENMPSEYFRYGHNTYEGLIYVPSGNEWQHGMMLLHEVAHLMVGTGISSNDDEESLMGYEYAVIRELKLNPRVWYRWQSVTAGWMPYTRMRTSLEISQGTLLEKGVLDETGHIVDRHRTWRRAPKAEEVGRLLDSTTRPFFTTVNNYVGEQ
jgi:hypothetical protein